MASRKYFGYKLVQREDSYTVPFFIFFARAKDIKKWAGVRTVRDSDEGTQRVLRETRRKAITRFLSSDAKNTIPNNILVAFGPEAQYFEFTSLSKQIQSCFSEENNDFSIFNGCDSQVEWGYISFSFDENLSEKDKPALIVDGQHRLYGISDYSDENLPILIVSLLNAPLQEQAFQFVVINNKAVRVPTDNVRAIIARVDENELQNRLLMAGVRYGDKSPVLRDINDLESSPFKNLLKWPYNKDDNQLVPLTAIEQSLKYLQSLFRLDEDSDSLTEIFCAIWRAVKTNYSDLWGKENNLMKKVSINALNEFISDRLKYAWEFGFLDIFESQKVEARSLDIIEKIPSSFWSEDWVIRIQDNANVRGLIKTDLSTLMDNSKLQRLWYEDLKVISQSNYESEI